MIQHAPETGLPECLAAALAEHDERRRKMVALAHACQVAEQAKAEFPIIKEVLLRSSRLSGPTPEIQCVAGSMREVAALVRWLGRRGYRKARSKPFISSSGSMALDVGPFEIWTTFHGGACRMVQVGERSEPVYELRCD